MIMGNFKKMYVGAIEEQREAGILYDIIAILSHGLKVNYCLLFSPSSMCYGI